MCLIMTYLCAIIFFFVWLKKREKFYSKTFFNTALMYFSAGLMWTVDSIFAVCEGESFFDISVQDAVLGFIIMALGLLVFAFMFFRELHKQKAKAALL